MPKNKHRYILFYKPYGVLSQFSKDTPNQNTLQDYISVKNVYPVGRLDSDSEGLLLLTNHGQLQHRLCHPRFGHHRTYWVQVERVPTIDALNKLEQGVVIKNYRTQPAQVKLLSQEPVLPERIPPIRFRKNVPTSWLEITLTEGKNRQVRRMTASVGFPTLRLVRIHIAHLKLDTLHLGEWRDLTSEEVKLLHKLVFLK
ncbi:MAG: pseudouridine synthase [Rivularia sp. (in: cyanobacteria)]|jgi:23S rRNA pseudouridine2457 synthase